MSEHSLSGNLGNDMRRISNSEVATFNTCGRKYYYEFDLGLQPKVAGTALSRGVLLHEILAFYYDALKEGKSHEQAVATARSMLMKFLSVDSFAMDIVTGVDKLLAGYWNFYQGDPNWEILEVEKVYDLPVTPEYIYSLRLDLLVRERDTRRVVLVDHKTAYNFWQQDHLALNPQFPKYIATLSHCGIQVDGAILNQIRTRELKNPSMTDLYKRAPYQPTKAKLRNALKEQILTSQKIMRHKQLPVEARADQVTRILNKQVCDWCDVKELCMSEFDGGDITHAIANGYEARTYGYDKIKEYNS